MNLQSWPSVGGNPGSQPLTNLLQSSDLHSTQPSCFVQRADTQENSEFSSSSQQRGEASVGPSCQMVPSPPPPDTGGGAGGWGGGPCRGAEEAAEKPDKPRAKKVKRMQRARFHKNRFCASSLTQAHFSSFDFPRRPLSSLFFHPGTQLPLLPSPTRGSAPPCRAGQLRGAPAAGWGGSAGAPRLPGRPSLEATPWGPGPFPPSGSPLAANIFRSLWLARVRFRMSST